MTTEQACKELGITRLSSLAQIEQAYKLRSEKAQLRMLTGHSQSARADAAEQMVRLASARETLQKVCIDSTTNKTKLRSRARGKPKQSKSHYSQPPTNLAEAWDQLFSQFPFSKTVTATIMVALGILLLISILKAMLEA